MTAVIAFLVSAMYWPGVSGAATSSRWAVLAIVPWLLREQELTAAHWFGAAFLGWSILTLAWHPAPLDGINAICLLLILTACFLLGNQLSSLRLIIIGAALGITMSSAVA